MSPYACSALDSAGRAGFDSLLRPAAWAEEEEEEEEEGEPGGEVGGAFWGLDLTTPVTRKKSLMLFCSLKGLSVGERWRWKRKVQNVMCCANSKRGCFIGLYKV